VSARGYWAGVRAYALADVHRRGRVYAATGYGPHFDAMQALVGEGVLRYVDVAGVTYCEPALPPRSSAGRSTR